MLLPLLLNLDMFTEPPGEVYRVAAGDVWHTGAAAGQTFLPGAQAGDLFHHGAQVGEVR